MTAAPDNTGLSSNRFLFVFDVCAANKGWEEPLRETAFDLIYSGVRGAMTNGDSFGIWLAGGNNDTAAGVEVWRQKFAVELASRAGVRISDRGVKGNPALGAAIADAKRVAQSVGDVTVIFVTTGVQPFQGLPFDQEINSAVTNMLPAMRKAKATINVAVVARDGKFVAWAANSPDYLVNVPLVPRTVKPAPAVVQTVPALAVPAAPPIRMASKPLVITKETIERERQETRAMATVQEKALEPVAVTAAVPVSAALALPLAAPTTAAPPVSSVAPPATASNFGSTLPPAPAEVQAHAAGVTSAGQQPVVDTAKPESPATLSPLTDIPHAKRAEAVELPAETLDTPSDSSKPTAAGLALPSPSSSRWVWIVVGAAGMAAIGTVIMLLLGRGAQPSLVSQAIAIERSRLGR